MRDGIPDLKKGEGIEKLEISKKNLKIIDKVAADVRTDGILEKSIRDKYTTPLRILAYIQNKDFDKCNRGEIKNLNGWINNSKYGWYSKEKMRIALKRLYRVLKKTDENPEIVKDVKPPKKDKKKPKTKMPDYLIKTNEEMNKIIPKLNSNRDKFHAALKWNTAARDVEVDNAKFRQIKETDGKLKIEFENAKNSGDDEDRKVLLHYCLPYYHRWKQEYKEMFGIKKDDELKDKYIFRKFNGKNKPLGHAYWLKVYKQLGKKVGIDNLTPKLFRKYVISRWQREGIPDALIKKMVGHSKDSRQLTHYSFHDDEACDSALLRIEGDKTKIKKSIPKPSIIKCIRCEKENKIDNDFCEFCGFGLSEEAIINQDLDTKKKIKFLIENQVNLQRQIEELSRIKTFRQAKKFAKRELGLELVKVKAK